MNVTLHLQVLGGFALRVAGRPVGLGGTRLHALLAYVALHSGAPQSRQQIAARFWPDVAEAQGRNNLRQLLHQLRLAWPEHEDWIETDVRAMQWRGGTRAHVDAVEFEREFAAARAMSSGDRDSARTKLARIVQTYAGDLLPDCYDEWIVPHRDRLHSAALGALDLAVRLAEEQNDHAAAVMHAEHMLRLDPLEERTYLRLMRLHALNGDPAAAARIYATCVTTLQRELGVAPGAEVRDAHSRLVRRSDVRSDAERSTRRPRGVGDPGTSLVGRATEWQRLLQAWHQVQRRAAVLALVTGEAGLGKSRLGEEMLHWADAQGIAVARTRAYAAEGRLAFSPVTGWLRSDLVRESLSRLDPLWRTEVARLVSELLLEQPELPRPQPLAEYWQREQFFEALARAVTGAAPALVLLMDDLQWCDADTLEWLHYLLRFTADVRLLVIATIRLDEIDAQHPVARLVTALRRTDRLVEIPLAPLDAAETAKLAAAIAGRDLDASAAFRLFSQTEGNPLFVVETVRAGLSALRGDADVADRRALPPKVHAVITDRLNQLSPDAREVAGLAATMGRAFSIDVLAAASDLGELRVTRALDELWQRRIARDGAAPAGAAVETWDFTHDRLREVASSEQSPVQRQRSHRRIAEALERARANELDAVSAEIASHYDRAREAARALPYYERAARAAARVFAYDEVQALLRRALALLDQLPETSRPALELALQAALSSAIQVTRGWASPDLDAVFARLFELSRSVGDAEQRATALLKALGFSAVRADFHRARSLLAELPAAMRGIESPTLRVMASTLELGTSLFQGRFARAEAVFLASKGVYQPAHHRTHVELAGADYGVLGHSWSSHGLWCLGRADEAFERAHESLTLARSLGHPFSKALALSYLATLHQMDGDLEHTRTLAAEAHAISERHHVLDYGAWSAILLAWVEASKDLVTHSGARDSRPAPALLRQRIDEFTATGGGARLPYYLSLLAGVQARGGAPLVALRTLDEAVEISSSHGDTWWDAELHRMRGDLLQRQGGKDAEALAALQRALSTAREQGAAMLEQRALESLEAFRL
jgi:DNA-binding SARP family transcriptional activator/tetratricopeptide (TPR) repeat protein